MDMSESSKAREIGMVAEAIEQETTGRRPASVTVVLSGDTVVITLRGTLSPAEAALAQREAGANQLQTLRRQLFATASPALRAEIARITGVKVREATATLETATGTEVQVFTVDGSLDAETWSAVDPS